MSYQDTSANPGSVGMADAAREQAGQLGTTTKEQASAVTGAAVDSAKQVAAEAKQQARQVTSDARSQVRNLVQQSRTELREQVAAQTARGAANMQNLSQQLSALAEGRPEQAGDLAGYVAQSGARIGEYAKRWQDGGLDGVVGDARGFARRRPGLFLLGALAAGFAAGRLIRGAQAAGDDSGQTDNQPELLAGAAAPAELPSAPDVNDPTTDVGLDVGYTGAPMREDSDLAWVSGDGAAEEG